MQALDLKKNTKTIEELGDDDGPFDFDKLPNPCCGVVGVKLVRHEVEGKAWPDVECPSCKKRWNTEPTISYVTTPIPAVQLAWMRYQVGIGPHPDTPEPDTRFSLLEVD